MNFTSFLKTKNFKLEPEVIEFMDVKFMSKKEKLKIYKDMARFLNNHFKQTLFSKALYNHFYTHCGFIAHYNIGGFYGEYFTTAASFQFNVNDFKNKSSECGGYLNNNSTLEDGEQFYNIYQEIQRDRSSLNDFYTTIVGNQNWGAYSDYEDLDAAIKNLFSKYLLQWEDEIVTAKEKYAKFIEKNKSQELKEAQKIAKAKKAQLDKEIKDTELELIKLANEFKVDNEVEKSFKEDKQIEPNLFDFMNVA